MIDRVFCDLQATHIFELVSPSNVASRRMVEACGLRLETRLSMPVFDLTCKRTKAGHQRPALKSSKDQAAFFAEVLLIEVTARFVSLLFVAFSSSRISLRSLCASSWPRSFAHSRNDP